MWAKVAITVFVFLRFDLKTCDTSATIRRIILAKMRKELLHPHHGFHIVFLFIHTNKFSLKTCNLTALLALVRFF